jgi:GT2 family glycosyltransferase
MARLTVIIATFRGRRWIRACLRSVLATEGLAPRVVVFDNGSTDGTHAIVEQEFPQVELITSPVNLGFACANNRVIRDCIARGDDHVFLLNDDARVEPGTIPALVAVAEKHGVSILSPLQYDYEGTGYESDFQRLILREKLTPGELAREFVPTSRVIGAAMLMRLSTLTRIGLFDPIYFFYAEEGDLCRRAVYHGFKVGMTSGARIYHGHKATGNAALLERMKRFNMVRGQYIYALKNPNQSLPRAFLSFLAQAALNAQDIFLVHSVAVASDYLLASWQVLSSVGKIRRRRRMERELSQTLWSDRELGA